MWNNDNFPKSILPIIFLGLFISVFALSVHSAYAQTCTDEIRCPAGFECKGFLKGRRAGTCEPIPTQPQPTLPLGGCTDEIRCPAGFECKNFIKGRRPGTCEPVPTAPGPTTPTGGCTSDAGCGSGNRCVGFIAGRRGGTCEPIPTQPQPTQPQPTQPQPTAPTGGQPGTGTVQPPGGGTTQGTDFLGYARFLYPFALSVAAVLAVIMIVIAGLEMMTASEGLRSDAKNKIWGAVLGLLLAVGSFLILNTINPQLINLKLTLPTVTAPGGAPGGGSPPGGGATAECIVEGKIFELTRTQCASHGGCFKSGHIFELTKAQCDSHKGCFIGSGSGVGDCHI